jgi:hypothetical protein
MGALFRPGRPTRLCARTGCALLITLALAACLPRGPESVTPADSAASESWTPESRVAEPPDPPDPPDPAGVHVYVILPASYGLHLAEGLTFASSGALEDLPVYLTREEAERALRAFEEHAAHAVHEWKVFRLEADRKKDVIKLRGEYRLSRPARVASVVRSAESGR